MGWPSSMSTSVVARCWDVARLSRRSPWLDRRFCLDWHMLYPGHGYGGQLARWDFPTSGPRSCPGAYSFIYGNVGVISLDANDISYEIPVPSYHWAPGKSKVAELVPWSRVRYTGYAFMAIDSEPGRRPTLTARVLTASGAEIDRFTIEPTPGPPPQQPHPRRGYGRSVRLEAASEPNTITIARAAIWESGMSRASSSACRVSELLEPRACRARMTNRRTPS